MAEEYDMNALYLYLNDYNRYIIGKIVKINDKSIRMEHEAKISKENFKNIYKLTDKEVEDYKNNLIRKVIDAETYKTSRDILNVMKELRKVLKSNEFICVDSVKLQVELYTVQEKLLEALPSIFKIDGKDFEFSYYDNHLIEKHDFNKEEMKKELSSIDREKCPETYAFVESLKDA